MSDQATVDQILDEIDRGPGGPEIAAFFDFDATIIDGYSVAAFYEHASVGGRSTRSKSFSF
jgi:putative phosphoserine phosphatase/1-acylglycerol-3-phosphate O-acyltransferase